MNDDYPSRSLDRIMVRLPDGMRDRLAASAKENKRSVNAEVVARLEASFAEPQKEAGLGPVLESMAREEYRKLSTRIEGIEALLNDIKGAKLKP